MKIAKNSKDLHVSLIVHIWIFISCLAISYSNIAESSDTMSINQTYTVNVTQSMADVTVSATMSPSMANYSVPVSATPPLPLNCHKVCKCNSSVAYATTMAYNMTEMLNATLGVNMTTVSLNASSYSMSPTPSSVSMAYTASANVTVMSYNSSFLPTPSSSISTPFFCPNESCWEEVECMTYSPRQTMTPYKMTISPTLSISISSSAVPPDCPGVVDCNGDCDGGAIMDCDVCIGGNTGVTSLRDCNRVCNGTAINSSCGICLEEGKSDPYLDCNNTCFGTAKVDSCNMCTGGNTGKMADYLKDECGICNGDNTSCAGCDNIPNSGLVYDACGICGGDGSTCTEIMATVPQTIASSQPSVWVMGAGLDGGSDTVCGLYDKESGDLVVNATASERNLTHARCEFQPWVNYTAGVYNLSVTIVYNDKANVRTNKSIRVYYYNSSDLSLTSVIPDEVLKGDLPQNVTLNGSGFFDWKETICYFGSQESSEVNFINDTHLECRVAAVDASTRFSVSLSMDGGLVRVGNADLTVFARAPNVTAVKFTDTAAGIEVQFDIEVDLSSEDETCDLFLTGETVAMLGNEPDCFLSNTRELIIFLGNGANITLGDNLVFKDSVLKAFDEQYGRFLSGSFPVNPPDSPLKPTPVITGPDTLSSCGNLTLSGSLSFGGGGRALTFEWELTSPNSGQDFINIGNVLNGTSSDADRVTIPGTLFESSKTYVFKLKAANFLNPLSFEEVTHSITKATDPVPAVTLSSNIDLNEGEVFVSEDLSIRASAIVAPCVNNTKVDFLWTVNCTDASAKQKVESSASYRATQNQVTLRLSPGVLTGGVTCTFTVTGSMNYNPNVKSSVSQDIKALSSPLEPAIFGGDRLFGRDSGTIRLDAKSLTLDPDQTSDILSCDWRCEVVGGGFCYSAVEQGKLVFASVSAECETTVESSQFEAGKIYKIIADVTKGSRSASASVTFTVVDGKPPDVWVDLASLKVKASDRVLLVGYYITSNPPVEVKWTSSQKQGFSVVDLSSLALTTEHYAGEDSFAQLILPKNFLRPGSKYRFKLTVNDGSKEGAASMEVEVRTGPTSGSFSVEPTSVRALDTVNMKATNWITDSDAGPLRYAFGAFDKGVCETYGAPSSNPERQEIVSQGSGPNNILQLCVVVIDKFDSYAIKTFNITSSPPGASDLTPDALENLFDSAIDDKLQSGDADAAAGALISITDAVLDSNETSDALKANISKKAQGVILGILDSTSINEDNAAPLLTAMVKTDAKAAQNSPGMAEAAVKILKGFDDKPLTDDKAEGLFKWMGDLAGESLENDTSLKETMMDFFDELADNLDEGLFLGDPPREVSDDRLGSVKIQYTTLESELTTSSKPGAPKFDPGESLADQFKVPRKCGQGKTCSGVVLELLQYKENLITVDENKQNDDVEVDGSQVLGIELKDPVTKVPLSVKNLTKPLKLTFSVSPAPDGKQLGCNYFDNQTKAWVKDGLTPIENGNDTLVCESTHATFFAPSNDAKNTTTAAPTTPAVGATPTEKEDKDMTGAIVGGVIGGIVFILLIVLGVWYCTKQKKKGSGRISPEDPPEQAPVD